MLLVLGALSIGAAAFLAAEAATFPARQRRELIRRVAAYTGPARPDQAEERQHGPGRHALTPLLALAAGLVEKAIPGNAREKAEKRLRAAGLANRFSSEELLGAKGVLACLGILIGILIASRTGAAGVLLAVCFGGAGFLAPDKYVTSRIIARREAVQATLPDALDLLAVSVEAGLGFDAALQKLTEYMSGPLIDEFGLTLNEMRIGESRIQALRRMASRMDVPELGAFVRAIVQADQLGSSMVGILRAQASDARLRRQFAAEEKAMKAPIKMLFPTAVFIFPAMFIVILGPALMNFGKGL